jgi:5-methylcytosine-specific restriction endonuclease McrA
MSKRSRRKRSKSKKTKYNWKKEIKVSQDYICAVCGKKGTDQSLDIHHCKPKSRGGRNTAENCCAVHRATCHKWIHETYGLKFYDPRKH